MSTRDTLKALGNAPKEYKTLVQAKDDPQGLYKMLHDREEAAEIIDWEFRKTPTKIRVKVLSLGEEKLCTSRAVQALKAQNIKQEDVGQETFNELFQDAVAVEILVMCLQEPEPRVSKDGSTSVFDRIFPSSNDLRELLTSDEMGTLLNLYLTTKNKLGGYSDYNEVMENLEAWIDRVAVGADYFLPRMPFSQLASLAQGMAQALVHLRSSPSMNYQDTLNALQERSLGENISSTKDALEPTKKPKSSTKTRAKKTTKKAQKKPAPKVLSPEEAEALADTLK